MKILNKPKQTRWLITILAVITVFVTVISLLMIYQTSVSTMKSTLTDIAESEKAKIKSYLSHSFNENQIIEILKQSYIKRSSIGETGEFVIAKYYNDSIRFLIQESTDSIVSNKIISKNSVKAEPIKKSLEGHSGSMIGTDYDGNKVYAGYAYISELGWGIVAKIDVEEISRPFIRTGILVICFAILLIVAGAFLFNKITSPMINEIMYSENKFRTLLGNIDDAIFIAGYDSIIVDANDTALRKLGLTHEELLKLPSSGFFKQNTKFTLQDKINQVISSETLTFDCEMTNKSGADLPVEITLKLMKYFDKNLILIIAHDITDRKISEKLIHDEKERLLVTIHSIGDAVITTDIDGRITLMNSIAEELTGWKLSDALNKNLTDVFKIINNRTRIVCENPVE